MYITETKSAMTRSVRKATIATISNNCEKPFGFDVSTNVGIPRISIPQRKARYHDKHRVRFKDAKARALKACRCSDTKEVKTYLKILGIKLDLRLTSAWIAISRERIAEDILGLTDDTKLNTFQLRIDIAALREASSLSNCSDIVCGNRVRWTGYSPTQAYITKWEPFVVMGIVGELARLDLISFPVPVAELVVV